MTSLVEEIIRLCEKQTDNHESLLSVLQEERKAVIASDLNELTKANQEKKLLILKIQKLEDQRLSIMEKLADFFGKIQQDFSLKKLCQVTEEPYSSRLKTCRSKLVSLSNKIRQVNETNKILISQSIKIVRNSMILLNNLINSNSVYQQTGKIKNKDHNGKVFSGEF